MVDMIYFSLGFPLFLSKELAIFGKLNVFPMSRLILFIAIVMLTVASTATAQKKKYKVGDIEEGIASFYADNFEGRITANGEKYSHKEATAAHKYLPFGSKVRVTDPETGKAVEVRINDRGPFVEGRILDLSKSVAETLGFIKKGTIPIKMEVLFVPARSDNKLYGKAAQERRLNKIYTAEYYKVQIEKLNTSGSRFGVQIGTFVELVNMMRLTDNLKRKFSKDLVVKVENDQGNKVYKVAVGQYPSRGKAEALKKELKNEYPDAFVVRY
jgi:rare lipoprotein A